MKSIKPIKILSAFVIALAVSAGVARAQAVTTTEIQRLQDAIYDASREVSQAQARDAALSSQLQGDLDELRDEVTYLKVKLRKNETVTRREYNDIRDRIERVRGRSRGETPGPPTPQAGTRGAAPRSGTSRASSSGVVPVGTEFDVRLQKTLSSATAQVEDRFEATTLVDLYDDDRVLVPAGSVMRGIVSSVTKAGRLERRGSLTVEFDQIRIHDRTHPIRATVTQALESEGIKGEAGRIGAGAGVGAIIGGILGGFKGALAGILIGGGGTIAATEGEDVALPTGTVLRVRLDTPLELR